MAGDPQKAAARQAARQKKRKETRAIANSSTPSAERRDARKTIRTNARETARATGQPRQTPAWAQSKITPGTSAAQDRLRERRQEIKSISDPNARRDARQNFRQNERGALRGQKREEMRNVRTDRRQALLSQPGPQRRPGPDRPRPETRRVDDGRDIGGFDRNDPSGGRGYVPPRQAPAPAPQPVPAAPPQVEPVRMTPDDGVNQAPVPQTVAPSPVPPQPAQTIAPQAAEAPPAQNIAEAVQQGIQQANQDPASPVQVEDPMAQPVGDPRPYQPAPAPMPQEQANPVVQPQYNLPQQGGPASGMVDQFQNALPPQVRQAVPQSVGAPSDTTLPPQFAAIRDMNARRRQPVNMYGGQFQR